jgi:toxin CcdB
MAQYDVYSNPQAASRAVIPYIVDIQSNFLSQLSTRLTAPLSVRKVETKVPANLCPQFVIEGQELVLMVYDSAAVSTHVLSKPITSLASQSSLITSAVDAVLSGF